MIPSALAHLEKAGLEVNSIQITGTDLPSIPIFEREGSDSLVATVLNGLGGAYGDLGDHTKHCDMLERALAIMEREEGKDSTEVASTLNNLGNAYGSLGDQAKKRDMLERALAIEERTYGRDHPEVANTLGTSGTRTAV